MLRPNRTTKHAGLWALTALLATVALSGCVGAGGSSSLYVKDALTDDADAVHVTFTKAQVLPSGGSWQTVYEGKQTIELLSLSASDAKERLDSFDLAAGAYDGLRIAVSEVEVTLTDGSTVLLNVFGNVVAIADPFTVGADGIDILVDFDLEGGVDLAAGTYTPVVKNIQTSLDDADGDGVSDFDDTDDDDDGREDHEDDDIDGDGDDDRPDQSYLSLQELCDAERDEDIADLEAEHAEELADIETDRQEDLADARTDYDAAMNDSESEEDRAEAQTEYDEDVAEINAEYDEDVANADAEYQEELSDIEAEHRDCLSDEEEDDDSDDDEDDESEDESEEEDEDESEEDDEDEDDE